MEISRWLREDTGSSGGLTGHCSGRAIHGFMFHSYQRAAELSVGLNRYAVVIEALSFPL
jgi:hypothetical protein